jgi:putative transposase
MMQIKNREKKYKNDNTLVYSCQYHVIFCPKYRRKVLINGIDERLKELILTKQEEYQYHVLEVEIMPDHVHLLLDVNPKIGIYPLVSKLKGYTSNLLRKEFKELRTRLPTLWTRAKFISTVGSVSLDVVKKYIESQKNK